MKTDNARNIIINSDSFQDSINNLEIKINNVSECIQNIDKNMVQITGKNEIWTSETALLMHDDYVEIEKEFEKINTQLATYLEFLKKTLEDYKTEEESINRLIEDNASYLDVNE